MIPVPAVVVCTVIVHLAVKIALAQGRVAMARKLLNYISEDRSVTW